ncbi:MAG: alanine racemase [Rhizobiaceae bacterium]|nr:MAG: alanine racemase [Rhizobiaceae bacterium]
MDISSSFGDAEVQFVAEGASGYLTIDLGALRRNYETLADMLRPAHCAAVVKADAYGLGATVVSRTLGDAGCRDFFVAQFVEAIRLKDTLPADARLYVLNGLQPGNEERCAADGIIPVLNSLPQLRRWSELARQVGRSLPAVLQVDSGMSRLGLSPEECSILSREMNEHAGLEFQFVMSHLACADEGGHLMNGEQLAEALYGGNPTVGAPNPMEPVVRLDVAVVQTRTVPTGTRIGYGGSHIADREMHLATIAAGYADGLPRALSGTGAVYHAGVRLPIVGRVSMDSIIIDVSALPKDTLTLGSLVEVVGEHQTLEEIAEAAGTISYEILTGLGHRYQRLYRQVQLQDV